MHSNYYLVLISYILLSILTSCTPAPCDISQPTVQLLLSNKSFPMLTTPDEQFNRGSCSIVMNMPDCCMCNKAENYFCSDLDPALRLLESRQDSGYFLLNLTSPNFTYNLNQSYNFADVQEAIITSVKPDTNVKCSQPIGGITFDAASNITIEHLALRGCGRPHRIQDSGALQFINCDQVALNKVNLMDSQGSAVVFSANDSFSFSNANYHITYCSFINAKATIYGGGILASFIISNNFMAPRFVIRNCLFHHNSAYKGGGAYLSYDVSLFNQQLQVIQFYNCNFTHNTADKDSALSLIALSPNNANVELTSCLFLSNSVHSILTTTQSSSCIASLFEVDTAIQDTNFLQNIGSALCLSESQIFIHRNVSFMHNIGYFGGAIFISDFVRVFVTDGASLIFKRNSAIYGGGVYSLSSTQNCIFTFPAENNSSYTIAFEENRATVSGHSLFLSRPNATNCELLKQTRGVSIVPNNSKAIASSVNVITTDEVVSVILGQDIVINATVKDYFGLPSTARVHVFIPQPLNESYDLNGLTVFTMKTGTNNLSVQVTGLNKDAQVDLALYVTSETRENYFETLSMTLDIAACPLGFVYDPLTKQCRCPTFSSGTEYILCEISTATICILRGYWFGRLNNTDPNDYSIAPCTSPNCNFFASNCKSCSIGGQGRYCSLSPSPDDSCEQSHSGVLCANCTSNHSFTFGATECVPDNECISPLPLILSTVYVLIVIVWLILLLKLDYRISSGHLFCFIYYFSIVDYLIPSNPHGNRSILIVISVFESLTQLNPQFLGYVPICSLQGLNALEHQFVYYLNPLLVAMVMVIFIVFLKFCSKKVRFSDSTPVRAVCLISLLSFTTLNETSFNIISYVKFTSENGTELYHINILPSEPYLTGGHIPFFIVALLVELVLIIPFTLFLFISPFLMRCVNLTKIKPFLDEFQGCYKDNFRWMASFYFGARQFYVILLTVLRESFTNTIYALQFLSLGILIFHMTTQPYKSWWLNWIDTIFLADILVVTLLFGQTGDLVFSGSGLLIVRLVATYVLISIPILYFFGVIFVAICHKFPNTTQRVMTFMTSIWSKKDPNAYDGMNNEYSTYADIGSLSNSLSNYREPLLDYFEEGDKDSRTGRRTNTTRRSRMLSRTLSQTTRQPSYSVVGTDSRLRSIESYSDAQIAGSQEWQNRDHVPQSDDIEEL